tara:strand:+ start:239 stop:478 length:240 start_codon:yes stop_codon:yes gene_type:complete
MGVDKLKNTWKQIKPEKKIDSNPFTFKGNDPFNTQGRVTPLNKDFYSKPYGKSNAVTGVVKPGTKQTIYQKAIMSKKKK